MTSEALVDYLLNSVEHEPNRSAAIRQLVEWGAPRDFAEELICVWECERPDLQGLVIGQQRAEEIVEELMHKYGL